MDPRTIQHPMHAQEHYRRISDEVNYSSMPPHRDRSISRPSSRDMHVGATSRRRTSQRHEHSDDSDGVSSQNVRHYSRRQSRTASRTRSRSRGQQYEDPGLSACKRVLASGTNHVIVEGSHAEHYQYMQVPSPPPVPSSSSSHMAEARIAENEKGDRRARDHGRVRRREHARPQPLSVDDLDLKPGDSVTVIEKHRPRPNDDYDWYDEGGMRVRVREI